MRKRLVAPYKSGEDKNTKNKGTLDFDDSSSES